MTKRTQIAPTFETIGQRIHRLRKASGLSLAELGNMAHVTDNAIVHIEKNRHFPRVDTAIQIARVFEVSLDYLCCVVHEDQSIK